MAENEIPQKLLEVLACPKCKGSLNHSKSKNRLECSVCSLAFIIENGMPILLVEKAKKL